MSIDIKNYVGDTVEAATQQESSVPNSYLQEANEVPLDNPIPVESAPAPVEESGSQRDHFKAFQEEVTRIKAERDEEKRNFQLQIDMLKANMAQPRQEIEAPKKFLDGMNDAEIPNVGDIRKEWDSREHAYQAKIAELEFAQYHPDYNQVLDQHLAPTIKNKPILAQVIRHSPNPAQAAYEIAKLAQQAQQNSAPQTKNANAQRIVENAKKPGTLSQAGGQGTLSKADYYATMSDADFIKLASQNLEGI